MPNYPYWIKQRFNPQLGTYYVGCGQMSKTKAREHERPAYGHNKMHRFETKEEYDARLAELRKDGAIVE